MIYLYKGDSLNKMKTLKVKPNIVYLDPPYGTKNLILSYEDDITNNKWSIWFQKIAEEIKGVVSNNSIIYVSIGHEEIGNAKIIMDSVFGRNAFIALMPRATTSCSKTTKTISRVNDFILVYKTGNVVFNGLIILKDQYKIKDLFYEKRGLHQLRRLDYNTFKYSATLDIPILFEGVEYFPGSKASFEVRKERRLVKDWCWLWSRKKIDFAIKNGFIVAKKGFLWKKTYTKASIQKTKDQQYIVNNDERTKPLNSLHFCSSIFSCGEKSTKFKGSFSYPKNKELIKTLLAIPIFDKKIILDPFAGSGLTGIIADEMNFEAHLIQKEEKVKKNTALFLKHKCNNLYDFTRESICAEVKERNFIYE